LPSPAEHAGGCGPPLFDAMPGRAEVCTAPAAGARYNGASLWGAHGETRMRELFIKGGPLMWPLLVCSLVSVTIIIERTIFWARLRRRRRPADVKQVFMAAEEGAFDRAADIGERSSDPEARVLASGLAHRDYGLRESMEAAAQHEIERMKQGLDVLDTIITLAPLLGILGTVLGIIQSFDLLGAAGIEDPKAVTGGIAQALLTTASGLAVAVVTLIPFNYLVARVKSATARFEKIVVRFEIACRRGGGKTDGAL